MNVQCVISLDAGETLTKDAQTLASEVLAVMGGDSESDTCAVQVYAAPDTGSVGPDPTPPADDGS